MTHLPDLPPQLVQRLGEGPHRNRVVAEQVLPQPVAGRRVAAGRVVHRPADDLLPLLHRHHRG
jgi:hypothetical protein